MKSRWQVETSLLSRLRSRQHQRSTSPGRPRSRAPTAVLRAVAVLSPAARRALAASLRHWMLSVAVIASALGPLRGRRLPRCRSPATQPHTTTRRTRTTTRRPSMRKKSSAAVTGPIRTGNAAPAGAAVRHRRDRFRHEIDRAAAVARLPRPMRHLQPLGHLHPPHLLLEKIGVCRGPRRLHQLLQWRQASVSIGVQRQTLRRMVAENGRRHPHPIRAAWAT